jgi:hypothetical protein
LTTSWVSSGVTVKGESSVATVGQFEN